MTFQVTEETLSAATDIPPCSERWSKGMPLDALCYEEFIKTKCLNMKVEMGVPSQYLQEPCRKILMVIRKYFTYERRFDKIHPHHIRLLMHFTGRRPLNLPFFLHQSLREMVANVHVEANQSKKNLSHISLIKFLIVEFIPTCSQHSQGPQRRLLSTHRKRNITQRGGGNRKGCREIKYIGNLFHPTINTPEKR
jgi:hypothetical protein